MSESVVVVVLQVGVVMIMCYCGGLSSCQNTELCSTRDDWDLCSASNSNGICNPEDFKVDSPKEFQVKLLDSLADSNLYNNGKRSGCNQLTFLPPLVYAYYCCDRDFEDRCGDCFNRAIKRLKDECAGRCGASVLLDICSLRYEYFDICER